MSKDIWHTTDEAPESCADIAFYVDGYLYFASYQSQYNQYGIFGADKVEKWCYVKELSSYILALETELQRTRKALDVAVGALKLFDSGQYTPQPDSYGLKTDASRLARNTLEQITTTEQKDVK